MQEGLGSDGEVGVGHGDRGDTIGFPPSTGHLKILRFHERVHLSGGSIAYLLNLPNYF